MATNWKKKYEQAVRNLQEVEPKLKAFDALTMAMSEILKEEIIEIVREEVESAFDDLKISH